MPKNTGLKICENLSEDFTSSNTNIIRVRGEDVPLIVSKLIKQNKTAVGITGEDLFKEFLLRNRDMGIRIIKRVIWSDENFIFKKPSLCLLGPKNKKFDELPKKLKVCINSKYKELAKKCCMNYLENKGYRFEKIYTSGSTEEFFSNGVVDLIIDIVCSGKSAEQSGLRVYDKLFSSDIVVIGGKNEKI